MVAVVEKDIQTGQKGVKKAAFDASRGQPVPEITIIDEEYRADIVIEYSHLYAGGDPLRQYLLDVVPCLLVLYGIVLHEDKGLSAPQIVLLRFKALRRRRVVFDIRILIDRIAAAVLDIVGDIVQMPADSAKPRGSSIGISSRLSLLQPRQEHRVYVLISPAHPLCREIETR